MKRLFILIIILLFIIGLTGCSFMKKDVQKNNKESLQTTKISKAKLKKIVGKYELVKMIGTDKSYTNKDINDLKKKDLQVTIELKDDKTAILNLFGNEQELKFNNKYIYASVDRIKYTYKNNILVIYNSDERLTFKKVQ